MKAASLGRSRGREVSPFKASVESLFIESAVVIAASSSPPRSALQLQASCSIHAAFSDTLACGCAAATRPRPGLDPRPAVSLLTLLLHF